MDAFAIAQMMTEAEYASAFQLRLIVEQLAFALAIHRPDEIYPFVEAWLKDARHRWLLNEGVPYFNKMDWDSIEVELPVNASHHHAAAAAASSGQDRVAGAIDAVETAQGGRAGSIDGTGMPPSALERLVSLVKTTDHDARSNAPIAPPPRPEPTSIISNRYHPTPEEAGGGVDPPSGRLRTTHAEGSARTAAKGSSASRGATTTATANVLLISPMSVSRSSGASVSPVRSLDAPQPATSTASSASDTPSTAAAGGGPTTTVAGAGLKPSSSAANRGEDPHAAAIGERQTSMTTQQVLPGSQSLDFTNQSFVMYSPAPALTSPESHKASGRPPPSSPTSSKVARVSTKHVASGDAADGSAVVGGNINGSFQMMMGGVGGGNFKDSIAFTSSTSITAQVNNQAAADSSSCSPRRLTGGGIVPSYSSPRPDAGTFSTGGGTTRHRMHALIDMLNDKAVAVVLEMVEAFVEADTSLLFTGGGGGSASPELNARNRLSVSGDKVITTASKELLLDSGSPITQHHQPPTSKGGSGRTTSKGGGGGSGLTSPDAELNTSSSTAGVTTPNGGLTSPTNAQRQQPPRRGEIRPPPAAIQLASPMQKKRTSADVGPTPNRPVAVVPVDSPQYLPSFAVAAAESRDGIMADSATLGSSSPPPVSPTNNKSHGSQPQHKTKPVPLSDEMLFSAAQPPPSSMEELAVVASSKLSLTTNVPTTTTAATSGAQPMSTKRERARTSTTAAQAFAPPPGTSPRPTPSQPTLLSGLNSHLQDDLPPASPTRRQTQHRNRNAMMLKSVSDAAALNYTGAGDTSIDPTSSAAPVAAALPRWGQPSSLSGGIAAAAGGGSSNAGPAGGSPGGDAMSLRSVRPRGRRAAILPGTQLDDVSQAFVLNPQVSPSAAGQRADAIGSEFATMDEKDIPGMAIAVDT